MGTLCLGRAIKDHKDAFWGRTSKRIIGTLVWKDIITELRGRLFGRIIKKNHGDIVSGKR